MAVRLPNRQRALTRHDVRDVSGPVQSGGPGPVRPALNGVSLNCAPARPWPSSANRAAANAPWPVLDPDQRAVLRLLKIAGQEVASADGPAQATAQRRADRVPGARTRRSTHACRSGDQLASRCCSHLGQPVGGRTPRDRRQVTQQVGFRAEHYLSATRTCSPAASASASPWPGR